MSKIYQIKIKLLEKKPLSWRRVHIRESATFWDLHVVIRNAYEWTDCQPHYFKIVDDENKELIIQSYLDNYENNKFPLAWNIKMKKYLVNEIYKIYYVYGTHENYIHLISLEKTIYQSLRKKYPLCIAGKGVIYESESDEESEISKQVRSTHEFKVDDVVLTESHRALVEHKVKLFDQLYS